MRKMIVVAGLALAACQAEAPSNETAPPPVAENATNYTAAVEALTPGERDAVFIRAIRDAGLQCQGVTSSEPIEAEGVVEYKDIPTWRATCTDGSQHLIQVTPDGTAKIVSRP